MSFCLSPRLGAIVALTAFFAFGAGAREANAAQAGGGGGTQDFNFSFSASLGGGGSISGSGVLVAEPDSMAAPGAWLVTNVTGGTLNYVPPAPVLQPLLAQDPTYSLTWAPPGAYLSNDNLLFPNSNPQLDDNGISFNVGNGAGYLNISDPP